MDITAPCLFVNHLNFMHDSRYFNIFGPDKTMDIST